jgi:hypothetical protein
MSKLSKLPKPVQVSFVGGDHVPWKVESPAAAAGPGLKDVARVDMVKGPGRSALAASGSCGG